MIVFHCGYPKCMSTFLQKEYFPKLRGWSTLNDKFIDSFFSEKTKHIKKDFQEKNIYISREHFLMFEQYQKDFPALNKILRYFNTYKNVKVLIIIRRPSSWVESTFRYKSEFFIQPEDVLDHHGHALYGYLNYKKNILKLKKKFKNIEFITIKFEELTKSVRKINKIFKTNISVKGKPKLNVSKTKRSIIYRSKFLRFINSKVRIEHFFPKESLKLKTSLKNKIDILAEY